MKGFVYKLLNPAFPKYLKIGKTYRTVQERAQELSSHSGLPSPFYVRHVEPCEDCDTVELIVHTWLEKRRVNEGREFFDVSIEEATALIQEANKRVFKNSHKNSDTK